MFLAPRPAPSRTFHRLIQCHYLKRGTSPSAFAIPRVSSQNSVQQFKTSLPSQMAASLLAAKRASSLSKAFQKLLSPAGRSLAPAARRLNTSAQIRESDDARDIDIDRRSDADRPLSRTRADAFPSFSDVMDPFVPRTVSQLLNMMDSMLDGSASRGGSVGLRRGWDAREDRDALYLRIDMPGLGKENVRVIAEQGTLVIRGEGEDEAGEQESSRRYSTRIDLAPELYKMDDIKAEMKNGVLKVVVPKVKETERKDVFHVNID